MYINIFDYEQLARKGLNSKIADYISAGACNELTLQRNVDAFSQCYIIPRVLNDVSQINTKTTLINQNLNLPLMIAPTAFHRIVHPDGELAVVRAAASKNINMIVSTMSTTSLEEIALNANSHLWFQLYIYKDREIVIDLIHRAEQAGYNALVITVDVPIMGKREKDIRNQFTLPPNLSAKNLEPYGIGQTNIRTRGSKIKNYTDLLFDKAVSWHDIAWIKTITKLPIILKGIMHREDAKHALDMQIDALVISNHGGRQFDGAPSAMDVVHEIAETINKKIPILIDGGFRRGTDILKALALGADCVLIGRPILWGLACAGQKGVENVLEIYRNEVIEAMALSGCATIEEVKKLDVIKLENNKNA